MKLKTLLTLCLIVTIHNISNAQTSNVGKIGVTFSSLSSNDVIYFGDVVGGSSYNGEAFYSLGINYIHPLKEGLEIESGVEYSAFTMEVDPHYPGMSPYNTTVTLLDIPVAARADFLTYFFANAGVSFAIDVSDANSVDNQSGIGGQLGIGAKYDFGFGATIFVNPYIQMHSVVPFAQEGSIQQRLTESAIRFGITYPIHRN